MFVGMSDKLDIRKAFGQNQEAAPITKPKP